MVPSDHRTAAVRNGQASVAKNDENRWMKIQTATSGCALNESMGRKVKTILAHSHGRKAENIRRPRSVFLDFSFIELPGTGLLKAERLRAFLEYRCDTGPRQK